MSSLLCKPSRGFLQSEHAETEERGGDDLEADRNLPLHSFGRGNAFENTVVYPVGDKDAAANHQLYIPGVYCNSRAARQVLTLYS